MNKDDLIKEQFKHALNSTIKAISGEAYPLKEHKNFKEFFTKNLKEQQISFAYLIGKGRWPLETLFKSDGCIKFQKINEIMILSDLRECIDN